LVVCCGIARFNFGFGGLSGSGNACPLEIMISASYLVIPLLLSSVAVRR